MHFRHDLVLSTQSITVQCRLFARYAEVTGTSAVTLELPRPSTVADAITFLRARVPGGDQLPERPLVAVNAAHALPSEELQDGDELALLPPLAGGVESHLTWAPIDVNHLISRTSDAGLGGTAIFLGTVRRSDDDGPVRAIEYSAYESMADAELDRIISESLARWPGSRVVVQHRLGPIPAGEASIAVVAAAAHRAEAFAASRYVIEEIKKRLPVWKKEIFEDGSAEWRGNDGSRGPAAVA